ncbi:hypothetical protein CIPAW_03G260800, partial [Carya illinoinensis]
LSLTIDLTPNSNPISFRKLGATRSLREEGMDKEELLLVESLRRIVPPSGLNPCTYIPGRGSGRCTLNGMNIAGNVLHAPRPAFPGSLIAYSSIPSDNGSQDQIS